MHRSKEYLLLANFPDDNYANAFILRHLIITAGHVAGSPINIQTNDKAESGQFSYQISLEQDLAISRQTIPSKGYELGSTLNIGDTIVVCGHHGPEQKYFEIVAIVDDFDSKGRIIIKRKSGKIFQLGMSGCPALNIYNQVIGVLVEGVVGTKGQKVYLETITI